MSSAAIVPASTMRRVHAHTPSSGPPPLRYTPANVTTAATVIMSPTTGSASIHASTREMT